MLYYGLLRDKARAMPLLKTCLQLAHTLVPVPLTAEWFEVCHPTTILHHDLHRLKAFEVHYALA